MAMVNPTFSVVVATFDRGPLIEATLQSVAEQSLVDFEVLVVSDGPAAEGLAETVARFDERFRLVELPQRCGSQFGPNNHGWSIARGQFIAYLGHDDIWLPGHLTELSDAFSAAPDADFAVSGCLYFGPPGAGSGYTWATGLFDPLDRWIARTHFFPPSSVAHRRRLPGDLRWPDADLVRRPVDCQFMLTAAELGCVFTSTREVTVLKFNSAFRYLSYVQPDDDEQRAALELLRDPEACSARVRNGLHDAASARQYMSTLHPPEHGVQPGEPRRVNARVRGLDRNAVEPLTAPVWIPDDGGPRGLDWYALESDGSSTWRWSGPNSRPRLLVPYSYEGAVRVSLHLNLVATVDLLDSLDVWVNRRQVPITRHTDGRSQHVVVSVETPLRSDRPSVMELRMPRSVSVAEFVPGATDDRRVGISIAGVHLEPLG
jgi:glycosyltransferase involved in cell wall biosynthesis